MRALQLKLILVVLCVAFLAANVAGQTPATKNSRDQIPPNILLQIIRAEDERRWDDKLQSLLAHPDANVRKRVALAAGRIGDGRAAVTLDEMLLQDRDPEVRKMVAFALGEMETLSGAFAVISVLKDPYKPGRAQAIEALGKITAAFAARAPTPPKPGVAEDRRLIDFNIALLEALSFEDDRRAKSDRQTILLGLTAVLGAKPEGAGPVVKRFLDYPDARIVADALNTLTRLRLKDGNEDARKLLVKHNDPIVRANAARVLGTTEDKQAFDALLERALHDSDERVIVSSIRALGSLKDARAAQPLLERGDYLLKLLKVSKEYAIEPRNEILEIATALGLILQNTKSEPAIEWLRKVREAIGSTHAPIEISFSRIDPQSYVLDAGLADRTASVAQGLSEIAIAKTGQPMLDVSNKAVATKLLHQSLTCSAAKRSNRTAPVRPGMLVTMGRRCTPLKTLDVPDFLRAYARFKPQDLNEVLLPRLQESDVIVRATAAELLGDQSPNDANTSTLIRALPRALRDRDLNDAALAIFDALGKQKTMEANEAIKTGLNSSDYLIRQKAVELLKANGVGDFSDRIGTVKTRNTVADYRRAIARIGRKVSATVVTNKGSFTIEFIPDQAPLTVDNFIQLARRRYFNGQAIPRVVPNFVVQAGDPRGDQNGGPGYQIRCEINEVPYDRGAVGMALSGKDTGGSQWFVTHSPQPHLDGGYTVFGRVISGMDVVDRIARGDVIRRVVINER